MSSASWRRAGVTVAAAVLAASAAACGHAPAPGAGGGPAPSAVTTSSSPVVSAPSVPATSTTPAPASSAPSALDQLDGFFTAATAADAQLKRAAVLVNGGVGRQTLNFSPRALAAVKALDTTAAARAIPAGLPAELQRRVLLAYSDLVSRHLALARIWDFRSEYPLSASAFDGKYLYRCMGNGAPAAVRFGADLAAARALAAQTAPVAPLPPDSRQAAEVALRTSYIGLANSGCMSCGGYLSVTLPQVVWQPKDDPDAGHSDGTINGITFRATYHAGTGWEAQIWAC